MKDIQIYQMQHHMLNETHSINLESLVYEMGFSDLKDTEWLSTLYLIASNETLFRDRNKLINFKERSINPEKWFVNPYSSGENKLLALAFNLFTQSEYYETFNGKRFYITPMDIFTSLDSQYRWVAIEAIKIRFSKF